MYSHQLEEGKAVVFDDCWVLHGHTSCEVKRFASMVSREASKPSWWIKGI